MASQNLPHYVFRNFAVWLDKVSYLGQASEVDLPNPKAKMAEMENAGMVMPVEVFQSYEKIEAKVKMHGLDPTALKLFGLAIGDTRQFMFTGAFADEDSGVVHSCQIIAWGQFKAVKFDTWKNNDKKNEVEYEIALRSFELKMDGQDVLYMDPYDVQVGGTSTVSAIKTALLIN